VYTPQGCSEQPRSGHRQKCQQRGRLGTPTEINRNVYHGQEMQNVTNGCITSSASTPPNQPEFHLSWHDFAIDATDVDAGIQASLVVGVNNVAPK
jgi:hypothetical protein